MTTLPRVHLGGTSRDELVLSHLDAKDAMLAAIVALAAVMPNGRDYVRGNGGSTLPAALEEHRIAFQALSAIHERMETILDHVANS